MVTCKSTAASLMKKKLRQQTEVFAQTNTLLLQMKVQTKQGTLLLSSKKNVESEGIHTQPFRF